MAIQKISINKFVKPDYRANEAFKRLRTNIQFSGSDVKVIALTSCVPNDGKSTVSFNLAVSFAEMGKKVLFIDADLRKSVLIGKYKISRAVNGFTHYLSGMKSIEEVIYSTNIDNLNIILSGPVPPDPAELLESDRFNDLIPALRTVYDYIIIDTPPLGSVVDSAIIASRCDGVALVLPAREVSYKFAADIIDQIKKTGARFLGVILNKVNMSSKSYYGKYYGKYYDKYYGNYGEDK